MVQNNHRLALMHHVLHEIRSDRQLRTADAVVFPGGFFRVVQRYAHLSNEARFAVLGSQPFTEALLHELQTARQLTPLVVFGVNSGLHGDQACLAISRAGIVGLAVKHFFRPSDRDNGRVPTTYAEDFRSPARFVRLPNGSIASLSDCYDLFGLKETEDVASTRIAGMKRICQQGVVLDRRHSSFRDLQNQLIRSWRQAQTAARPDIAIAVIHRFALAGREGYWQRHGLAAASAHLHGALVVGASHFGGPLPLCNAPLAACGVPRAHLTAGLHRLAHPWPPTTARYVQFQGRRAAVIRLFVGRMPSSQQ
jgi:hypothetical protein